MKIREVIQRTLSVVDVIAFVLIIWRVILLYTGCQVPVSVVLTGSMEPAFWRGDIIFAENLPRRFAIGDIAVFQTKRKDIPIVHRVLKSHMNSSLILTKGDNNQYDDRFGIYPEGKVWLYPNETIGRVYFLIPYLGLAKIWFEASVYIKYAIIVGFSILAFFE